MVVGLAEARIRRGEPEVRRVMRERRARREVGRARAEEDELQDLCGREKAVLVC